MLDERIIIKICPYCQQQPILSYGKDAGKKIYVLSCYYHEILNMIECAETVEEVAAKWNKKVDEKIPEATAETIMMRGL